MNDELIWEKYFIAFLFYLRMNNICANKKVWNCLEAKFILSINSLISNLFLGLSLAVWNYSIQSYFGLFSTYISKIKWMILYHIIFCNISMHFNFVQIWVMNFTFVTFIRNLEFLSISKYTNASFLCTS